MTAAGAVGSLEGEVSGAMAIEKADFESLMRDHQAMVYSIAYHFFQNEALAEEVAQEVFLQLYKDLDRLKSPAHVGFWLRRTTSHRCIDHLRRHSARHEVQLEHLPEIPESASAGDPLLRERLRRLVASLPEKSRMVVILRYGEDLDVDEIGRILKMPVRTVWSNLYRALALLREKAPRYLGEGTL
jgi:RNA polymerase sigma-70 factor (ECF subfamily)